MGGRGKGGERRGSWGRVGGSKGSAMGVAESSCLEYVWVDCNV